jgi:prephenate dehydratase
MRVAHLGPAGTYSEEAALRAPDADPVPFPTLPDAIAAVAEGAADVAVVPIENSLEGTIGATLDTLATRGDVTVTGELVLPIAVHLIGAAGLDPAAVTRVLSHPQPLAQCAAWLRARLPGAERVATSSTADAVRQVLASPGEPWAALGPRRAAELYGGRLLAEDVADDPSNATRFVWVSRTPAPAAVHGGGPMRTSLAFWGNGDDEPGWLVRCLSEFAFRGVNLSKIESRPLRGRIGGYRFFVDCEGGLEQEPVAQAIAGLHAHCREVRVLGSYPQARQVD